MIYPKAQALAESQQLIIDPRRLEYLNYPRMVGGFGTVRLAKIDQNLVAVKDIRIAGADDDRARFALVRHHRGLALLRSLMSSFITSNSDLHES